jgi:hypothetical protein
MMTTGTGLFVLGAWLVVVAAYATPNVNQLGVNRAIRTAWQATFFGVLLTIAEKLV